MAIFLIVQHELPDRKKFAKELDRSYVVMEKKLKKTIEVQQYVSTTADIWSCEQQQFHGVAVHWIDAGTLKREKATIASKRLWGQRTYDAIATELADIFSQYGLTIKCRVTLEWPKLWQLNMAYQKWPLDCLKLLWKQSKVDLPRHSTPGIHCQLLSRCPSSSHAGQEKKPEETTLSSRSLLYRRTCSPNARSSTSRCPPVRITLFLWCAHGLQCTQCPLKQGWRIISNMTLQWKACTSFQELKKNLNKIQRTSWKTFQSQESCFHPKTCVMGAFCSFDRYYSGMEFGV